MRVADLGLGEVLLEAQPQHLALAVGEHAHQPLDAWRGPRRRPKPGPRRRRVGEPRRRLVVLVARAVERDGAVGAGGLARLEHLLLGGADALGDLGDRRRAAEVAAELARRRGRRLTRQLLQVARDADRPALVAEVALELAEDRRHREAGERESRAGSKRSIALSRPSDATWTRSSSGSSACW